MVIACARVPDDVEALTQLKKTHPERLHLIALDAASTTSIQVALFHSLLCPKQNAAVIALQHMHTNKLGNQYPHPAPFHPKVDI